MVSVRLCTIIMAAAFLASSASSAEALEHRGSINRSALKPRSTGEFAKDLLKRVHASRPYSPDLFLRQELEDEEEYEPVDEELLDAANVVFDFPAEEESAESETTSDEDLSSDFEERSQPLSLRNFAWSSLFKRVEDSEEELHARGLVDDEEIQKRGSCSSDDQCGSQRYCSTKRNRCFLKLNNWKKCSRDGACGSGYCCESSAQCEPPRTVGRNCHGKDNACNSGYCSVVSDKCRHQASHGNSCRVDAGCKGNMSCVNGSCQKTSTNPPKHPNPPKPTNHPSPSGSPKHPRTLFEVRSP